MSEVNPVISDSFSAKEKLVIGAYHNKGTKKNSELMKSLGINNAFFYKTLKKAGLARIVARKTKRKPVKARKTKEEPNDATYDAASLAKEKAIIEGAFKSRTSKAELIQEFKTLLNDATVEINKAKVMLADLILLDLV